MKFNCFHYIMFATLSIAGSANFAIGVDQKQEFLFVLNGMKKERSAIKSGVCRMKGKSIFKSLGGNFEDMEGDLSIFSAFDDRGRIRFDRTQPGWIPDMATAKEDLKHPGAVVSLGMKKGIVSHKYFRNLKRAGHWQVGSTQITVSKDEKKYLLFK